MAAIPPAALAQPVPPAPVPPVAPVAPMVYVEDDDVTPDVMTEELQIKQILHWIGFVTDVQKNAVYADSMSSFADLNGLTGEDIDSMARGYANRTVVDGRIHIGIRRIKRLKALVHWAQDFRRISKVPTVVSTSGTDFIAALEQASERARIRKQHRDDSDVLAKEASPGPLKTERDWVNWESKFVNYCSTLSGVDGVPLSYVIRENDNPLPDGEVYASFLDETIYCAPLNGSYFDADKQVVHQALISFTAGQQSEDWLKSVARYKNGRRSMQALRNHFSGEGNATRRIAEADRMKKSLHYKNEKSLSFETFLTRCQKMFNIYEKQGEPMLEDAKVRFLFERTQHSGLQGHVQALKASITTGTAVSYTTAANHLSTAVSELPEYTSAHRSVAGLTTGTGNDAGGGGIYNDNGTIAADKYIPNWGDLSKEDRLKVLNERKRLGIKLGKGGKGSTTPGKDKSKAFNKLKKENKKFKRKIQALQSKITNAGENEEEDNVVPADAGDGFGGRHSKKKSKTIE